MFEHICIFQAPHLPNTFGRFKCYFIVFKIRKLLLQFERGGIGEDKKEIKIRRQKMSVFEMRRLLRLPVRFQVETSKCDFKSKRASACGTLRFGARKTVFKMDKTKKSSYLRQSNNKLPKPQNHLDV